MKKNTSSSNNHWNNNTPTYTPPANTHQFTAVPTFSMNPPGVGVQAGVTTNSWSTTAGASHKARSGASFWAEGSKDFSNSTFVTGSGNINTSGNYKGSIGFGFKF